MVKVLPFRFEQYFAPFTMLLVEGSSETGLFRHLFFGVRKFKNTWAIRVIFFLKIFKIECKFRKTPKKITNYFSFLR